MLVMLNSYAINGYTNSNKSSFNQGDAQRIGTVMKKKKSKFFY